MADLSTYFGLGYRLDITSQLATTYTEARTTFSLGNQSTSVATPGTITASGVAQFYAITNPTGSVLVEAGPLKTGQPVIAGFGFTVEDFSSGNPKIVPQGHDAQGASMRLRGKRSKKAEKQEYAGPKLNKAIEEALAKPPAPEPVVEAEPAPMPEPEAPQPAPVVVEPEPVADPEPVSYEPPPVTLLEDGRRLAETRAALVRDFLARAIKPVEPTKLQQVERVEDEIKVTFYDPIQDEADAIAAINKVLRDLGEEEIEVAA